MTHQLNSPNFLFATFWIVWTCCLTRHFVGSGPRVVRFM